MNKQQKSRLAGAAAALALVLAGVWFARAPYSTLQSIQAAAERRDLPELNRTIDFPSLKSSVKLLAMSAIGKEGEPATPGGAMARVLAGVIIGPVVDSMVTPEAIAHMFSGQLPSRRQGTGTQRAPQDGGAPGADTSQDTVVTRNWEGLSTVRVNFRGSRSPQDPGLTFVMRREGLSWRLSAIER